MSDTQQHFGQQPGGAAALRKRAEERVREMTPAALSAQSPEAIRRALHELQVHQVELEMQNEALRAAQVEIEAGRARYFDLYDLAPVGYCTLSEKGLFLEANLTAATLLGTKRGDLLEQPISRFILTEDQDIYYLHRKKLLTMGEPQECELRLVKLDGAAFWAHLRATTAQAEDGALLCRMVISDITERKRTEEALRASERFLRSTVDGLSAHIVVLDDQGEIILTNKSYREFGERNGIQPSAVSEGINYLAVCDTASGEDSEAGKSFTEGIRDVLSGNRHSFELEYPCHSPDEQRWFIGRVTPFTGEGPRWVIVAHENITERKQAENRLKEEFNLTNALLDNIPNCMSLIVKKDTREIVASNQAAYEIGAVPGKTCFQTCALRDDHCPFCLAPEMWKSGQLQRIEVEYRGTWYEGIWAPLTSDLYVHYIFDITARKLAESYREMGRNILQVLNEPGALRASIQRVLSILKTQTGVDAVGMRLQEGDDFPYFVQDGFSKEFLRTDNTLVERGQDGGVCRDKDGNVCLECTCGLVVSGKTDPANPLFTPGGSCWTNDSFALLDLAPEQDPRLHPRNNCIHQGYASVALIPVRTSDRIVGLIQLNAKPKGRFTLETIELLEGIAAHIGSALMRKRAEDALRESEAQYRGLFDQSHDAVMTLAPPSWRFTSGNPATVTMFDVANVASLVKLGPWDVSPARQPDGQLSSKKAKAMIETAMRVGSHFFEWTHQRLDGTEIQTTVLLSRMEISGKRYLQAVVRDITERKQAEALEAEKEAAKSASRTKSQFLASMSHELRTPLNAILGFAQILDEQSFGDLTERQALYVRKILASSRHLRSLVEEVLDLNKIEAGQITLDLRQTPIASLITDCIPVFEETCRSRRLALHLRIASEMSDAAGMIDAQRVRQVVYNLLENAVKFTPEGGSITVEARRFYDNGASLAQIVVADTGIGISPDLLHTVFEPFYQEEGGIRDKTPGTGLGLSLCKQFVELHGGTICAESAGRNQGSRFVFTLPLCEQ